MVGGTPGDGEAIALDGDKLRPRTDQRKGGNGFGINEDGAGYTLTGVDRHGMAYKSECFNKVSHAKGKNGEGERWDNGEVASTRNVFDIGETRTQELVVCSTNSNGGDVMPTLDGRGQSASGPGAQEDKRGGYIITRIEKEVK